MLIKYRLYLTYFINIILFNIIATQNTILHLLDEKTNSEMVGNCSGYAANQQGRRDCLSPNLALNLYTSSSYDE